MNVYLALTVNA